MTKRMRLVGWQVQPIVMADDGGSLTLVQVNPAHIPAEQWGAFKAGGDQSALDQLRQQIEAPDDPLPKRTQRRAKTNGKVAPKTPAEASP